MYTKFDIYVLSKLIFIASYICISSRLCPSLSPPPFLEVPVPSQVNEPCCFCVIRLSLVPLSTFCNLNLEFFQLCGIFFFFLFFTKYY